MGDEPGAEGQQRIGGWAADGGRTRASRGRVSEPASKRPVGGRRRVLAGTARRATSRSSVEIGRLDARRVSRGTEHGVRFGRCWAVGCVYAAVPCTPCVGMRCRGAVKLADNMVFFVTVFCVRDFYSVCCPELKNYNIWLNWF